VSLKSIGMCAVGFCLFGFPKAAPAAPQTAGCELPQDLHRKIATKYPGTKVVTLPDLQEDDKGFFQSDHGNSCPGLIKVDFYGDGKPTLALVLIPNGATNQNAQLVVAHQVEGTWKVVLLASGGPNVPVVWSLLPPGDYRDVYGRRTIRATRPVIVFFEYESWGLLYAWTGKAVSKIWIAD